MFRDRRRGGTPMSASDAMLADDSHPAPPVTVEDLYTQFAPTIYARCRQILRDAAAAEDATQEIFVRIRDHLTRIEGPRQALGWLYRAATNHCLNELRDGRTHAVLLASVPAPVGADSEQRFQQRDLVARLIRDLPEELALIAWLYHVDELQQGEIAEICGVSRRTIIARLQRFAEQARHLLQSGAP
jgi:RNA polymerase sigma-70 factor (ECF subfamily)